MQVVMRVLRLRDFTSQDVARDNAAAATARLARHRRERESVDAYLAQRADVPVRARVGA